MAKRTMFATRTLTVPLAKGALEIVAGDEVQIDRIPTGSLESMARLGQLVERSEWERQQAEAEAQRRKSAKVSPPAPAADPPAGSGEEGSAGDAEITDWKQAAVSTLALKPEVVKVLADNGLATIEQVLTYARDNEGLTKLNGVGEATEKVIEAAIQAVMPQQ